MQSETQAFPQVHSTQLYNLWNAPDPEIFVHHYKNKNKKVYLNSCIHSYVQKAALPEIEISGQVIHSYAYNKILIIHFLYTLLYTSITINFVFDYHNHIIARYIATYNKWSLFSI